MVKVQRSRRAVDARVLAWSVTAALAACEPAAATLPANAPGNGGGSRALPLEICHDLTVYGGDASTEDLPYVVQAGEHFHTWHYRTPWDAPVEAVRLEWTPDAADVIRGWSLFEADVANAEPGTHADWNGAWAPDETRPILLAEMAGRTRSWELPDGVALTLPEPGRVLSLRWHYTNYGEARPDRSRVRICSVPAGTQPEAARLTVLGSEDFAAGGLPAGQTTVEGRCEVRGSSPVRLLAASANMQQLGRSARLVSEKPDGTVKPVFEQSYAFDEPRFDTVSGELAPGDLARVTCEYATPITSRIMFGPSVVSETCFLSLLTTPALPPSSAPALLAPANHCL